MKNKPELTFRVGRRARLRLLCDADIPQITQGMNDPEVTQYILQYMPKTTEAETEWFKKLNTTPNDFVFGIENEEEELIGVMGLHGVKYIHGTATTGAYLGNKEYWGKGYGSEAKMLLLQYAFDTLGLRKICGAVIAFNERCLSYQAKCGYKEEARLKNHLFKNGRYWDEILVSVYREDWFPIWAQYQETGEIR